MCSVEDENKDLRFEIEQQLGIIESQKQEIHGAHRKIECLNLMKVEMEIEIEALNGLHQINGNLEAKVKSLEAELISTRLKCDLLESELRTEKENQEQVVTRFNEEIVNLKNQPKNDNAEDMNQLFLKLHSLEETSNILTQQNLLMEAEQKNLADKIVFMELSLNEKNQQLEEMKNLLDTKSNDLQSALKHVEELQEEKATLSTELVTLKSCPAAENKRGNSLFAEVDDKRKSVSHRLDAYKKKCAELKKSLFKKNAELRALEADHIDLKKKFEQSEKSPYESIAALLESHKTRNQDLMQTVSILQKRPENPQIISLSEITSSNYDSIQNLVENERKKHRDLMQEMEKRSLRELAQGEELFLLKQKVRTLTAQSMKDSARISELSFKLETKLPAL